MSLLRLISDITELRTEMIPGTEIVVIVMNLLDCYLHRTWCPRLRPPPACGGSPVTRAEDGPNALGKDGQGLGGVGVYVLVSLELEEVEQLGRVGQPEGLAGGVGVGWTEQGHLSRSVIFIITPITPRISSPDTDTPWR